MPVLSPSLQAVDINAIASHVRALPGRIAIYVGDRADQYVADGEMMLPNDFLHMQGEQGIGPFHLTKGIVVSVGVSKARPELAPFRVGDVVGCLEHVSFFGCDHAEYDWLPKGDGELRIYGLNGSAIDEVFKLT